MSVSSSPSTPPKRGTGLVRELVETAVLTLVIFLVVRVALQNFKVEGSSMLPNLHNGEYLLVNKVDYMLHSPQRGDVIVFHAVPAGEPDKDFIKRVIALPGETVGIRQNTVFINHRALHEPYAHNPYPLNYVFPTKRVPPGDYFVLGDNRNDSFDSSKWPLTPWLPRHDIIGKAWVSYWPPNEADYFQTPSYQSR